MNILIVEDEPLVAMSLELVLRSMGHQVTATCADFASAMAAVDGELPHLALVDLRLLRGTSGLDVAAELARRGIPAILVTGKAPALPLPHLAIGCLRKPHGDTALSEALQAAQAIVDGGRPAGGYEHFELY